MKIIYAAIASLAMSACSPTELRVDQAAPIAKSQLQYSVTQLQGHDNYVYLKSLTPDVIPYWSYDGGSSTKALDTLIFPFSGQYVIKYGVNSAGGYVGEDSTTITVTNTDLSTITDPAWSYLTNGQAGKTWVLDMTQPIGWYGPDYLKNNGSADDWSYHPTYVGNEWVMPNLNYGSMKFDLNNAKNYTPNMTDFNGVVTNCSSKFNLDLTNNKMTLTGCGLLYGGDYHSQVSNWNAITIIAISDTSMTLGVWRDQGAGLCWIGYTFIPKP